jgi:hypothetical protein
MADFMSGIDTIPSSARKVVHFAANNQWPKMQKTRFFKFFDCAALMI